MLPPPKAGKTVNIKIKAGKVRFKLPGSKKFVTLTDPRQIPLGTIIDTTHGRVTLTSAADTGGNTQHAWFYRGIFKVGQTKGSKPVTELSLAGPKPSCKASASAAAAPKKKKPKTRRLWGDGNGLVPDERPVLLGDRARHALGRDRHLPGHADAGARRGRRRARLPQAQDDPGEGREAVPGTQAEVSWVSVFAGFLVAHMVGDYLFQTDWQARNKRGGLSGRGVSRRALVTHVTTYTLAFLPAFMWIGSELDAGWAVLAAALVFLPHLVIDDGRIVRLYLSRVKHADGFDVGLAASVDQSFHVLSLWLVAMLIGAA